MEYISAPEKLKVEGKKDQPVVFDNVVVLLERVVVVADCKVPITLVDSSEVAEVTEPKVEVGCLDEEEDSDTGAGE